MRTFVLASLSRSLSWRAGRAKHLCQGGAVQTKPQGAPGSHSGGSPVLQRWTIIVQTAGSISALDLPPFRTSRVLVTTRRCLQLP